MSRNTVKILNQTPEYWAEEIRRQQRYPRTIHPIPAYVRRQQLEQEIREIDAQEAMLTWLDGEEDQS